MLHRKTISFSTAELDNDIIELISLLTINPGSPLTMDITVDTMLDNIAEGDETFLLEITAVSGPGMEGFPAETVITIDDDDDSKFIVGVSNRPFNF